MVLPAVVLTQIPQFNYNCYARAVAMGSFHKDLFWEFQQS